MRNKIWFGAVAVVGLLAAATVVGTETPTKAQTTSEKSLTVILLPYETKTTLATRNGEKASAYWGEWAAYGDKLKAAGVLAGGGAMQAPVNGRTLRGTANSVRIQNGPYANSPEQLGGFLLLNVSTMEEALTWAKQCPATLHGGAVEVRPLIPTMAAQNMGKE